MMSIPTRRALTLAALVTLSLSFGCKTYTSGLQGGAGSAAAQAPTLESAMEIWTNERGTKEGLLRAIDAFKAVAESDGNQEAMIMAARGLYFLADGYTDTNEEKGPIFEQAVTWGERAMAADAAFKARIDKGDKPAKAVEALQKDDQMALYWTASALGKWARIQGFSTLVKYKGYVAAMMTKCTELDETAFYSGPIRYWGAFYAVAPAFAGGDMDKSKEMFDKSIGMNPEYLGTYVLYADAYAVKKQDKKLFLRMLNTVLEGEVVPELAPEMAVEKKKAEALLAKQDELFAD